jgi:hypothetical protein
MSKKSLTIDEIETPSSLKEKYYIYEKLRSDLGLTREKRINRKLRSVLKNIRINESLLILSLRY